MAMRAGLLIVKESGVGAGARILSLSSTCCPGRATTSMSSR
jgi:hypothetical protein